MKARLVLYSFNIADILETTLKMASTENSYICLCREAKRKSGKLRPLQKCREKTWR